MTNLQSQEYKVVIPAAGLGTRISPLTKTNKALITVGTRPAISHIIEKFPCDVEIIIALGYAGALVKDVVKQLHPDNKITFIEVENFQGEGSGLGHTLNECRSELQCPFIFVSNDTLIGKIERCDINPVISGNWAGFYSKQAGDGVDYQSYRTLALSNNDDLKVLTINPKGLSKDNLYIGLCGVKDFSQFWDAMSDIESISVGESYGLSALDNISGVEFKTWDDTGNMDSLERARTKYKSTDAEILEKEDEAIWFTTDQRVVKFSINKEFIRDRVLRTQHLPNELMPKLLGSSDYCYQYNWIEGNVVSKTITGKKLIRLLDELNEKLWFHREKPSDKWQRALKAFYKDKTFRRVEHFHQRFERSDSDLVINDKKIEPLSTDLNRIDWDWVCQPNKIAKFHGDLHFENIVETKNGSFKLLDWRQNFGEGECKFGDTYYDLAKLHHGMLVNHSIVNNNQFSSTQLGSKEYLIDIDIPYRLRECENLLFPWSENAGYDPKRIKILTALIFLNIAGLHEYPYSQFLYLLGRLTLNTELDP